MAALEQKRVPAHLLIYYQRSPNTFNSPPSLSTFPRTQRPTIDPRGGSLSLSLSRAQRKGRKEGREKGEERCAVSIRTQYSCGGKGRSSRFSMLFFHGHGSDGRMAVAFYLSRKGRRVIYGRWKRVSRARSRKRTRVGDKYNLTSVSLLPSSADHPMSLLRAFVRSRFPREKRRGEREMKRTAE